MYNLGDITDSLIRNIIVYETPDSSLQERLLRKTDLTLEKYIQIARTAELSRERMKTMTAAHTEQVRRLLLKEPRKQLRVAKVGKPHITTKDSEPVCAVHM